jgi:hypothetical protein
MKRRLAALFVAALSIVALAAPASSTAALTPRGNSFHLYAPGHPILHTPYGKCALGTKGIAGQVPFTGSNEVFYLEGGDVGCFEGSKWIISAPSASIPNVVFIASTFSMKISSMPGCKISTSNLSITGKWINGTGSDYSDWVPSGGTELPMQNESSTAICALAGKKVPVTFEADYPIPVVPWGAGGIGFTPYDK